MPGEDGGQKRVSDPSEMELELIVNCLVWDLGTELGSLGDMYINQAHR